MSALIETFDASSSSSARADELFHQHQQEIYRSTDALFARLFFVQWIAAVVGALFISPQTWDGQTSQIHIHVWAAIFLGGAITLFPIWMTRAWPGAAATRHIIAVAQMLMSALFISVSGGRIETHFHVFGSLVILSFYRDWRVLIPATVVVALDHFLRGIYAPYSVYGVLSASPWRSIEHAAWVVFEDVFLVISCLRSINEMRSIANRTAALEASEHSFRQIFEEAPIGMAVINLDERFRQANAAFCKMVDYTEEELLERSPLEISHPSDVAISRQLADARFAAGGSQQIEKRYLRKNGEIVWAARTGCVIRDQNGGALYYLVMVEDITERKRAEERLQESQRQLEAAHHTNQLIMDNSQAVICTINEEGRFLTVNAACEALWDFQPNELVGADYLTLLVHPDEQAKTKQFAEHTKREGKATDFVNRCVRKDGTLVDVLWSASWSQNDRRFFCVAHDVTERERHEKMLRAAKEEADRANRAKSEFLSRMSHELRTPLNAILGFGQLLERQEPTAVQRPRIQHIVNAGRHLLNLINEVLDISRIESDKMQLSLEPVSVSDTLDETLELIRPLAAERTIKLGVATGDKTLFVLADRQRFKQVLLNLVSNGVKYTPPGGSVTVSYGPTDHASVRLEVRDTGPGISKDKLSRVFTPFDRLDAERSNIEGTGLGLALCKRLVQAMRGSIGVESTPGAGSNFWVTLSAAKSPLEVVSLGEKTRAESVSAPFHGEKRTVLYIEDNLSNLTLVEQIVQQEPGIQLLTAMQGRLGLDLARQHAPDLILLDLHLPDLAGWDVLAQLQASETTRHIPTIVVSADATSGQIKRLMKAGARAYLTKPLDITEFYRVLEQTTGETHSVAA